MAEPERSDLLDIFLLEAEDCITILDKGLYELEPINENPKKIEDLFRAAHTLKGAASIVKIDTISKIAHILENILEDLQLGKRGFTNKIKEVLSYILDTIKDLTHGIADGNMENYELGRVALEKIDAMLSEEQTQEHLQEIAQATSQTLETTVPEMLERRETFGRRAEDREFFTGNFVKVNLQKVEKILDIMGELIIMKNLLSQNTSDTQKVSEEIGFIGSRLLREIDNFSEKYAYSLPGNVKYIDPLLSEFGELEFDRYDELNLFSRKLREIMNDLTEALKELSIHLDSFSNSVKTTGKLLNLLRSDISEMRMIEIGRLFHRFVDPIKDMAVQYNKKVELVVSGGDTKIDKTLFEKLFEPLMHLLRNAVAHGIERPDERIQKGKTEKGYIHLSAKIEGNTVTLEVKDDGKGIDTDSIFEKAVKIGLLTGERPAEEDILPLIFISGFSTAEFADMASGRGIGMSAVSKQISAVNGMIEVQTKRDIGTTFRIKVPSSLAISNLIFFIAGNIEFAIPANIIEEIIQIDIPEESSPDSINFRGKNIYAKDISDVFGIITKNERPHRLAVICNIGDKKVALIVDGVIGQQETIVRPLNAFIDGLYIYSGVTVSGDGKVRFVINPSVLFEIEAQPSALTPIEVEDYEGRRVLVVDDSLSVRKYLSSFMESKGLRVYSASNGEEALDILADTPVDMIITDLEMPVMHGYELMNRIKSMESLKNIPIVVITSRSAEKHKEKAIQYGAVDYIVKPFEEESLLAVIKKHAAIPT